VETEPRGAAERYDHFNDSPGSTHELVVGLVPAGSHVLEFGCSSGYMSAVLKERLGCTVVGIEVDQEAAEMASKVADRVIAGDAESLNLEELLEGERFGAVLFADVLEHLKQPGMLLRRIRPFLTDDAVIVASLPNVAHGSLRLALLGGEFRYRETGLLDQTHLRFFTRASIQDLFEESGYVVTQWQRQRVDIDAAEIALPPGGVPEEVRVWLASDPEATTYQFVVRAVAADEAGVIHGLRRELADAQPTAARAAELERELERDRLELDRDRRELEELRARRDALDEQMLELASARQELETLRRAHETLARRLAAERVSMTDTVSALERNLDTLHQSRSFRYTAPLRNTLGRFRRR
jgi:2-polyprenyl-3-methyl-5-hydroxy-6-metoxy-1,4-benzoquinol methylase